MGAKASARAFIDSSIVLYLLSADAAKADRAEAVLAAGGVVSVQVLNEVTNLARRKLGMAWAETDELLTGVRSACAVEPLTVQTYDTGRQVAERYGLSTDDAMIASAALLAGCDTLFSEDMQHGLLLERQLRVCNPFIAPS